LREPYKNDIPLEMFGRHHHHPESPTNSALGACGYPQSFLDALVQLDAHARSTSEPGALILVSIDNLAMIMSGYSMAVAEAVMQELAQVISEAHSPRLEPMRIQRDQFGILMGNTNESVVKRVCHEIEKSIRNYSYNSRYGELHCLSSTACQMIPDVLSHPEETLGRAIVALTESPSDLGSATDISGADKREEMGLANFLGQAVQQNRIRLAYQPVIDSHTGAVAHYEALLRLFG
jgi:GGDEF domain-containing protein